MLAKNQEEKKNKIEGTLCGISIIVTEKNSLPCIELRKTITDSELIKNIISCAFHERPIIILPTFNDKLKSIGSLVDKGILYRKNDQFYFTI